MPMARGAAGSGRREECVRAKGEAADAGEEGADHSAARTSTTSSPLPWIVRRWRCAGIIEGRRLPSERATRRQRRPSITATSADKAEGQSGSTPFTFTVTRTGDLSGAASAHATGRAGDAVDQADVEVHGISREVIELGFGQLVEVTAKVFEGFARLGLQVGHGLVSCEVVHYLLSTYRPTIMQL